MGQYLDGLVPITRGEISNLSALSSLCLQIPYLLRGVRNTLSMGPKKRDLQIFRSLQLPTNLYQTLPVLPGSFPVGLWHRGNGVDFVK